jgi:hypothetical protein
MALEYAANKHDKGRARQRGHTASCWHRLIGRRDGIDEIGKG